MVFSHTIQMFSKENEKKVTVFLLFDRIKGKGVGFTLYLYAREGKLSMIPVMLGSGISVGDALLWLIYDMGTLRNNKEGLYM